MAWENSCITVCNDHLQAEAIVYLLQKKVLMPINFLLLVMITLVKNIFLRRLRMR